MHQFMGRGFRISYVEQGDGGNRRESIVFAHGFVMDHTMFAPQFEDLPDTYRCIAWDMRGHGESECPIGPWSMQDTVDDLVAFIEGLDAAPCHLVGMSIGGMIAMRVALQRPDLVRSLVLIDTNADREDDERAAQYRGFQQAIEEHGLTDDLLRLTLPIFYAEKYRTSEPDGVEAHIHRAKAMPTEALVEGLRVLLDRDSVVERLGEIRVPTLVIHGMEDLAIPMSEAERISDGIPGAKLVQVAEAGHTTPLESPDLVNLELYDFFAKVPLA